jgi:hypothetical protein
VARFCFLFHIKNPKSKIINRPSNPSQVKKRSVASRAYWPSWDFDFLANPQDR